MKKQQPFVKPLGGATIIGAAKITDFPILSEVELNQIADPIQVALDQGVHAQQPAAVPTFVLCRMIQTIRFSEEQWRYLYDLLTKIAYSFEEGNLEDAFDDPEIIKGLYTHLQALEQAQMSHAKREAVDSLDESLDASPPPSKSKEESLDFDALMTRLSD